MKHLIIAAQIALAVAVAAPAHAQSGFELEANGARFNGVWGGELGAGYRVGIAPGTGDAGFALRGAAGAFVFDGGDDGFARQTFRNGQTRCRELATGRFAPDERCSNTDAEFYARAEALIEVAHRVEFGGGARFGGGDVVPYGTIAVRLSDNLLLRGNAGPDYYAGGLTLTF